MAQVDVQQILESISTHPSMHAFPDYCVTYATPGSVRSLEELLGFSRAIRQLNGQDIVHSYNEVTDLNGTIGVFHHRLETHDPSEKKSGLRENGKRYYYPTCPKEYPLDKLHQYAFSGNAEKIERYQELYDQHRDWHSIIQTGLIPQDDFSKLFIKVDDETHGTSQDFLRAWLKLQRQCTTQEKKDERGKGMELEENQNEKKKEEEEEEEGDISQKIITLKVHPMVYATRVHDLLLSHMPFIRGNRRLARILLCHTLVKCGIFPPIFWSAPSYEAMAIPYTKVHLDMAQASTQEGRELFQTLEGFRLKSFVFIVSLCTEAESIYKKTTPVLARPLEIWEHHGRKGDIINSIMHYVSTRKRVQISDLLVALSIFFDAYGSDVLRDGEEGGKWYWSNISSVVKDGIKFLQKEGRLKIEPCDVREYERVGCSPSFNQKTSFDKWIPSVLVGNI